MTKMDTTLQDLLKLKQELYNQIKIQESKLKQEYNKLKLVHMQLEEYIIQHHPNPKCRICNCRLSNHGIRHKFQAGINNLSEL